MSDYEVFISFKNTDDTGHATRDVSMAEALYRALKQKGIRVFFSKYSIDESARADYVDAIDNALECTPLLVAVGTSRQNMTSRWVKSEINQFRALMNADDRVGHHRTIVSYRSKDFPPDELPSGLQHYQSFDELPSLIRFIETFLKKDSGFRNNGNYTELLYHGSRHASVLDSATLPEHHLQIGTMLDGRYQILSLAGKGGMAYVYRAWDTRLGKYYAVKELRTDGKMNFELVLESLRKEAELLKKLDHPAIPKIYDIISTPDSLIIVEDFVSGESLNQVLFSQGPIPEDRVLDIARQVAQLLDYLHSQPCPIIYRDLKPANIILDTDGQIKLIDFGTAREYSELASGDTTSLGTVGYAAPEQFGGMGQTDARTDIYTLGVTLYQLVTGKNPAEPPYEILPIRQVDPNLSRELEDLIRKCTHKNPEQRFQSAKALLRALERLDKRRKRKPFIGYLSGFTGGSNRSKTVPQSKSTSEAAAAPTPAFRVPECPNPQPELLHPFPAPPMPAPPQAHLPEVPQVILRDNTEVLNPPTEPLSHAVPPEPPVPPLPREPFSAPLPPIPPVRKVTVRPKKPAEAAAELDAAVAKLSAMDPDSQKIIFDLIHRLSR